MASLIAGLPPLDVLAPDVLAPDVLAPALPLRGGSGLPIPLFGPLSQTSVLMPAWEPNNPATAGDVMRRSLGMDPPPATGKRKEPKRFRVPGDGRGGSELTGLHLIPNDDGSQAILHSTGRTAGAKQDGAALLADALLTAGVLRESDWCGGLERTITRGLTRWANEEKGAGAFRWFGSPLSLVFTDDSPAYATATVLTHFRDNWRLPPDKPVGFFGLRYQSAPRPVHVRRVVQDVEEVWPGLGYGLLNLLEMTFVSSVKGYTPIWGARIAAAWDKLDSSEFDDSFQAGEGTAFDFGDCVPLAAATTPFRLDKLDKAIASNKSPRLLPVLQAARAVFDASRAAGLRYHTLNHCGFLSWNMSMGERNRGAIQQHRIDRLDRAPVVYTVWDPENDVMTRLVDDYTEFARSTWQYTDLTWMHCWQQGFAGKDSPGGVKELAVKERFIKNAVKKNLDILSFRDEAYVPAPMPDGGIAQAVTALSMVLDIVGALDRLLTLMHTPETLMEQVRQHDELTLNGPKVTQR